MLRMDFYRMVRGKSLWICLAVMVGIIAIAMGMMAYMLSPGFLESMQAASGAAAGSGFRFDMISSSGETINMAEINQEIAQAQSMMMGLTPMSLVGTLIINGGALALIYTLFVAIFYAGEYENGFSKNVFTSEPNRTVVLIARVIETVALALVFALVGAGSTLLGAAIVGAELMAAPALDMVIWFALLVLVMAGFGMLTMFVIWLTRKMAAGIVVGIIASSGLLVMLVQGILSLFPAVSRLADFTLFSSMSSLAGGIDYAGGLSSVHIACVGIAFLLIYAVLSYLALKKKDI